MTHGQDRFVIQIQLCGQFSRRLTFANASQQQDNLHGRPLAPLKHGARVQVVDRSTRFTTMNFQFAGLGLPKLSRLFQAFLTLGTVESFWMKMLEYPLNAVFII